MKISTPTLGMAIAVIGIVIISQIRAVYLARSSKTVLINFSSKIILRYAPWAYFIPLLALGCGLFFGYGGFNEQVSGKRLIYLLLGFIAFFGGVWMIFSQWGARITIFEGKLIYTEGSDRFEISTSEVSGFSINRGNFYIKRKFGKTFIIPSGFKSSEIIVAFLNQAIAKNS